MKFFVLGAGRWGTALAVHLGRLGHDVLVYDVNEEVIRKINEGIHPYVEGIYLKNVKGTTNLKKIYNFENIICALPVQVIEEVVGDIDIKGKNFISASKGINYKKLKRISEIVKEFENELNFFVLSGPSFAEEVSKGLPTAVVLAYENKEIAIKLQKAFNSVNFRVYLNDDVAGVELGGALKNVIAIAVGVSDGLGYGYNARTAIITRGIHEIAKIGEALGGKRETFFGLSGAGDLILTATSDLSRNRTFGILLGKGYTVEEALKEISQTVEGVKTAKAIYKIIQEKKIHAPICTAVYRIVSGEDPKIVADYFLENHPGEEFHL
ncbi:MAG TPA: NAD(P)H-dependent glycerol-3-phosphate dehydrogenase [Aquifex aeolicus]|nr:NAD(P)H-dependent glycerol-3-phosphate dehydrogenase [Aquifex aeolicus]